MALSFDTLFKAFKENIAATVMSCLVLAVVALYTADEISDNSIKNDLKESNKNCATEKHVLAIQVDRMNEKHIEVLSALKEVQGQMKVFKDLGIIK